MTKEVSVLIHTDLLAFSRILDNLLSNAIKFSPSQSKVFIKIFEKGNRVCISIRDQGPGFTEEDKAKLFQKFQKLSARPTGEETSTGLGLAIVKTLIDQLNGEIKPNREKGKGQNLFFLFQ